MSYAEYRDWIDFYSVEPWGTPIEDDRFTKLFNASLNATTKTDWVSQAKLFPRSQTEWDAEKEVEAKNLDLSQKLKAAFMTHNVNVAVREAAKTPASNK